MILLMGSFPFNESGESRLIAFRHKLLNKAKVKNFFSLWDFDSQLVILGTQPRTLILITEVAKLLKTQLGL